MHIGKNYRYTGSCTHRLYTDLYLQTELGHVFCLLFSQQCEKHMDNYFALYKKGSSRKSEVRAFIRAWFKIPQMKALLGLRGPPWYYLPFSKLKTPAYYTGRWLKGAMQEVKYGQNAQNVTFS